MSLPSEVRYRKLKSYKYATTVEHVYILKWDAQDNWTGRPLAVRSPGPTSAKVEPWLELTSDCRLIIQPGYAWDGTSGPSVDTKTNQRGGLIHDALYQLCRSSELDPPSIYRNLADKVFRQVLIEDGMWRARAAWHYHGVAIFGAKYAAPQGPTAGEQEYRAP
ncbi:MAG: hypothetical protein KAJ42_06385 [Gemmatimonadetes bacterium]|nr:hypothetical protein [Gemmatimonadota bacterium]